MAFGFLRLSMVDGSMSQLLAVAILLLPYIIQSKEKRLFRIKSKVPAHKDFPPQPQQFFVLS
jgi:hypothetical protein